MSAVAEASAERPLRILPSGWAWARLGDICDAINGRAFKSSEWRESGLPIVRIQNLKDPDAEFNYFAGELDDRHRVHHGDLLFAWSGTPGTSFGAHIWKGPDAALNQHIFNIKFNPDVLDPRYFCLALNQNVSRYVAQAQGGVGLAHITKSKFLDSFIPLAPKVEQLDFVAEIEKQFSRLDEAVANLKRVAGGMARYKAATLSEAFAPQPGWTVSSYGEIGVVTTGFTPSTTEAANFGGAIPFFKPTDLDAGENVVAARERLSDLGMSKGRLIPANSVLVTCIGATIGKTGLARVACATNQQINAVSPDPAKVDAHFLYWWTVSPRGREQIVSNASATTLPILNKSKFSALAVPVPAIEDQKRIVAKIDRCLSIAREVEAEVDANLKRVQALRHAILARAFSRNEHES